MHNDNQYFTLFFMKKNKNWMFFRFFGTKKPQIIVFRLEIVGLLSYPSSG